MTSRMSQHSQSLECAPLAVLLIRWCFAKDGDDGSELSAVFNRRTAGFTSKHLRKMTWAGVTNV
jgi:hypothetical protein